MKKLFSVCAIAASVAVLGVATDAAWADGGMHRFQRSNAAGGTTAGVMRHHSGPGGGAMVSRRVVRGDGTGNGTATTARAWQTPAGGLGGRAAVNTRAADGSATHQSGIADSGARGSLQSQGSASRDADGNIAQSRTTSATNAATGNSYQGSTRYDKDSGLVHEGSCMDAAGNTIACPGR